MIDHKEKSPRPRQRHMGDVTMGFPSIVYSERAPDVKTEGGDGHASFNR